MTARGRSPSARGTSAALAAAFFASVREARDAGAVAPLAADVAGEAGGAVRGSSSAARRLARRPTDGLSLECGPDPCGRRTRVGGIADGAYHRHALSARGHDLTGAAGVDPADGEVGLERVGRSVLRRARDPRGRARAWSPSRRPGRRRCSPRRWPLPARSARASASKGRSGASSPTPRRTSATSRSSWPTWTPSASHASARSGRSLTIRSARYAVQSLRSAPAAMASSPSVACLSRSCTTSTPPLRAASTMSSAGAPATRDSMTR